MMGTIDIQPFLNAYAWPLFGLLLVGLAAWGVAASKSFLDARATFLDAQTREKITALESAALDKGVAYILAWAKAYGEKIHPTVNNWLFREAAQVALNHASGVLADNGDSPDQVAAKLLAHLPLEMISTDTTGQTVKTTTVTVETLAPIGVTK